MNYNRNQVDGDFAIRNDLVIGGDTTTRGTQVVEGDLHVTGAIVGSSVSSKDMGLFATEALLNEAVPSPEVGMYAAVGSTFPATLYICSSAGTWSSTSEQVTYTTPTSATQQAMKAAAQSLVNVETTRAEFAEDTLKTKIAKEVTDRQTEDAKVIEMVRKLAVFMSDHHHHHLHADWLWKELLLSLKMNLKDDIITILGVDYQLTRYVATVDAPDITDDGNGTVTITSVADSTVYYTTDGSTPTTDDNVYTEAFTVTEDCTIRAIAVKDSVSSAVASHDVTLPATITGQEYGTIKVSLSYDKTSFTSDGGTAIFKNASATQEVYDVYSDGSKVKRATDEVVTATPVFSCNVDGVLDATTHYVSLGSVTSARTVTVTVAYTAHGKTGSTYVNISQSAPEVKAYIGASAGIPTAVDTSNDVTLSNNVTAPLDTRSLTVRCVWAMIPSGASFKLDSLVDSLGSPYTITEDTTSISGYTLYYYKGSSAVKALFTMTFKTK